VPEKVLVTGGAGFIGRRVVAKLAERGHSVRVLDSMVEQVHQGADVHPEVRQAAEVIIGDVRDEDVLGRALDGVDSVINLAAEVGVGQSMYEVTRYVSGNDFGTAMLMQKLIEKPVRRVVTASSMSIYGEGLYRDQDGRFVEDADRGARFGGERGWEPLDTRGRPLSPLPTPEWKRPALTSVYALGKFVQERLTMTLAPAYGMEAACLRLFNVYGPGQSLSNPYTGVLAIFASRFANGQKPVIYEDGEQRRDFVYVDDVANAFLLALESPQANGGVFNVGSGNSRSVNEVAQVLARAMGKNDIVPEVTLKGRVGDIRHCFCDPARAASELGFTAKADFAGAMGELVEWVARQEAIDKVDAAQAELARRGLVA
jgi:dTDP-L-rhamnose 4-epimerase